MRWRKKPVDDVNDASKGAVVDGGTESADVWANSGLTESQLALVKAQADTTSEDVSPSGLLSVYRYATPGEFVMMAVSTACSLASGAIIPVMLIIFGQLVGNVSSVGTNGSDGAGSLLGGGDKQSGPDHGVSGSGGVRAAACIYSWMATYWSPDHQKSSRALFCQSHAAERWVLRYFRDWQSDLSAHF